MEVDDAKSACVHARLCVCVTVIKKHWRAAAGVPEDGIRERQREAAGNE